MTSACGQPASKFSSWSSQSSVLAKRLWTTRTRHRPPARGSMVHSVAVGGPSGPQSFPSWRKRRGGSQAVTFAGMWSISEPVW